MPSPLRLGLIVLLALVPCATVGDRVRAAEVRRQALHRFLERVERMEEPTPWELEAAPELKLPKGFQPWWDRPLTRQLRPSTRVLPVNLEGLILNCFTYSARIRGLNDARLIALADLADVNAAFDWRAFMDSQYVDTSDPVGSLLTTGGASRYRDHNWQYSAGFRQQNALGGQFEVSQQIGHQTTNSIYFVPPDQGTGRLAFSYSQPLLQGAGRRYNTRYIALARSDADVAEKGFLRQAQQHILDISQAYWELYLARALFLQKQRLYERARAVYEKLESRRDMDAQGTQIVQARAAVARRRSEILRAKTRVRNIESTIRALVNDPRLAGAANLELLPQQQPSATIGQISMKRSLTLALLNRPKIGQCLDAVCEARVRLNIADNELMPALDLILESYVSGLEGRSDVGAAMTNQFSQGEPSYTVGLRLDLPLHNRAAKARYRRQQLELQQRLHQLADTVETILSEVETAVRNVRASHREMEFNYHALAARQAEVDHLQARWDLLPGEGNVASVMLEQLLQSQEKLAAAEFTFARSQIAYDLNLTTLKQADGTLLQLRCTPGTSACLDALPPLLLESRPGNTPIQIPAPPAPQRPPPSAGPKSPVPSPPVVQRPPRSGPPPSEGPQFPNISPSRAMQPPPLPRATPPPHTTLQLRTPPPRTAPMPMSGSTNRTVRFPYR